MAWLGAWLGRSRHERTGFALYGAAVAAARERLFYAELGVPDTLDGRFDLIGAHVFLLIHRLRALDPPGPRVAQAVFDAMFSDMDRNLRELGVGDLSVGRRVKSMWEAFHGRAAAYQGALAASGAAAREAALSAALARNVWRGAAADGRSDALARLLLARDDALAAENPAALLAGRVTFAPVAHLVAP